MPATAMQAYKEIAGPYTDHDPVLKAWENVVIHHKKPSHPVRKEVLKSWIRCRELGLDPLVQHSPMVISKKKLAKLRKSYWDFIEISKSVMQMIEISVRGSGFIVTLTEKGGHVLEVQGDEDVLAMALKNYYIPGCMRSTEQAGTNGIGLCLEEGKPIQLTGAEHYNVNHHPWTCSSAPIRNSEGELIGAITLSGHSVGRHKHTLALVTAAAKNIESQLLKRKLIEDSQRLNSMLTSIYDSISDGFIAMDNKQIITHMNHTASKMLGVEAESLIGKSFFDVAVPDKKLVDHEAGEYFEATEISFKCFGGQRSYMCRMDPILTPTLKLLGMIITMAEKRQIIDIVKKIGGNYSKYEFSDIKGHNRQFLKQIKLAKIAAMSNSRILITGESGTGKELFAQAIHSHSHQKNGPFVAISCSAIPRDLIESELFGYKGGAFTGARQKGMIGKFELANKGTLFLDEINGMPLDLQTKLLRVLQQNEIMRLGDTQTIPVDVRIIAASNTDLINEVDSGNFREDLYYRLNVIELCVPSLRDRKEDIELLASHILDRLCKEMKINKPKVSEGVIKAFKQYNWPGNVRELENIIERAIVLTNSEYITDRDLSGLTAAEEKAPGREIRPLSDIEKEHIKFCLDRLDWNIGRTAEALGIHRNTLRAKIKEYDLEPKK
jgi:transcriptional regulator of acetoin/glycerol metabolism